MVRDARGRKNIKKSVKATPEPQGLEVYNITEHVRTGARKTDIWVRKHPWKSAGIVAVIGAVVAKLLFWKKRR